MSFSRRLLLGLPLAMAVGTRSAWAAEAGPALIERLYGELLAVMKEGKRLSFDQRYSRLAPVVGQVFDLPLMTRLAIGPGWAQLAADQQQRLTDAFTRFTISNYASRFDNWNGERFEVSPATSMNANGVIVDSRIIKSNGEPVTLKYLMRSEALGGPKVIDVYLSGTVSELATRRSEFASVLQRNGADWLVRLIEQKSAALRAG